MPRHALLFRHCVRSTSSSIKHGVASFEQASDYMGIPPPEWGVPEHWCTTTGLEMMSGTGRDLRRVLGDDVTQLSVVSDTVMRDVDTSGALMAGFCRERLPDCATLRLDPLLFEASRSPELDLPPLCDRSGWDDEQQAAEVRRRLASVPRPAPVAEALATMQELYGVGAAGNLTALEVGVSESGSLTGAAPVLKSLAQTMMYAYASRVPLRLRRAVSAAERLNLFAWQHWYRSVKDMTALYATDNAALMQAIVAALDPATPQTDAAAAFIGHDGNLDGVGLLVGLRDTGWDAPPYLGGALVPTPPGAALHFSHDDAGVVSLRFLYPTFIGADGTPNTTGVLAASPIFAEPWSAFRARVASNLRSYAGAQACFDVAVARAAASRAGGGAGSGSAADSTGALLDKAHSLMGLGVGLLAVGTSALLLAPLLALWCCVRRPGAQRATRMLEMVRVS